METRIVKRTFKDSEMIDISLFMKRVSFDGGLRSFHRILEDYKLLQMVEHVNVTSRFYEQTGNTLPMLGVVIGDYTYMYCMEEV